MKIFYLVKKELIEIFRQKELLFLMFVGPVIQIIILGYVIIHRHQPRAGGDRQPLPRPVCAPDRQARPPTRRCSAFAGQRPTG